MNYHFIAIEGNIGAGKTTLTHLLSKRLNARLLLEQFADNPFLEKFYESPKQYAFPLELFFMAERYKQLKDVLHTKDMFQSITISDYLFAKCLLFARINLPEEEFRLYQKLFDIMHPQLLQPDIVIYLQAPLEKLQQNIRKRNRSYEQKIPAKYLSDLSDTYSQYIRQSNLTTLIINTSHTDFLSNTGDLNVILEALEQTWEPGPHHIDL